MIKFVDLARQKGVKRFVLCAGTSAAPGKDGMGRVWEHFMKVNVEFAVLRPSWFMGELPHIKLRDSMWSSTLLTLFCLAENLIEPGVVYTVTQLNTVFTATQDGKIPFISADDIANVAYHALTDAKPQNRDLRVLGPENLTYDQVISINTPLINENLTNHIHDRLPRLFPRSLVARLSM